MGKRAKRRHRDAANEVHVYSFDFPHEKKAHSYKPDHLQEFFEAMDRGVSCERTNDEDPNHDRNEEQGSDVYTMSIATKKRKRSGLCEQTDNKAPFQEVNKVQGPVTDLMSCYMKMRNVDHFEPNKENMFDSYEQEINELRGRVDTLRNDNEALTRQRDSRNESNTIFFLLKEHEVLRRQRDVAKDANTTLIEENERLRKQLEDVKSSNKKPHEKVECVALGHTCQWCSKRDHLTAVCMSVPAFSTNATGPEQQLIAEIKADLALSS